MVRTFITTCAAFAMSAGLAAADDWVLDGDASRLAFGSVKNSYTGEVHGFNELSGRVSDGKAMITIDLASLETWVDIRNERMIEHVFKNTPKATITAEIDMDAMDALGAGETLVMDFDATLDFLGTEVDVYTEIFVARMTDDKVLVSTNDFAFVTTEDLEIEAGVDKLKELASLESITRSVPVSIRLMFDRVDTSS